MVHTTEFETRIGTDIHVERSLKDVLIRLAVVVVATGIFGFRIDVVTHRLIANAGRAADLGGQNIFIPAATGDGQLARGLGQVLAGFRTSGFGLEVEVAPNFGRTIDWAGGPAYHIDAVRCPNWGGVVTGVIYPTHAPKIYLTRCAPNIQRTRDPKKGLGKRAGCDQDQIVYVGNIEAFHHTGAHGGHTARRFEQGFSEPENGFDRLVRHQPHGIFHRSFGGVSTEVHGLFVRFFVLSDSAGACQTATKGNNQCELFVFKAGVRDHSTCTPKSVLYLPEQLQRSLQAPCHFLSIWLRF